MKKRQEDSAHDVYMYHNVCNTLLNGQTREESYSIQLYSDVQFHTRDIVAL